MKSWNILFSSILIACSEKTDDSATDTATNVSTTTCDGIDCYGECLTPYERTVEFGITEEEYTALLDASGTLPAEECSRICTSWLQDNYFSGVNEVLSCAAAPGESEVQITCSAIVEPFCEGRFHEGVCKPSEIHAQNHTQRWLSRAAQSERASVQSFVLLAKELEAYQLPPALLQRIHKAAQEEIGHARMMYHLCAVQGATIPTMQESTLPQRSLFDIALENAVEGCVHERYAALQAHYQAQNIKNNALQPWLAQIAHEETEHTTLADELHSWIMPQLSSKEQEAVHEAKQKAQQELEAYIAQREVPIELQETLGLPNQAQATMLVQSLHQLAA